MDPATMMMVANAAKGMMSGGKKVSEANQEDHMGAIGKQPPVVERAKARLSEAREQAQTVPERIAAVPGQVREQAQSIPERIAAVPGQIRENVQNVGVKNIKPNLQQVKQRIQETPEQIRENVQELGQHLRLRDEDQ
jgi:gas vesicle protein